MPFNLLKTIQQNLGYPELKKVDPNTQDVIFDTPVSDQTRLGQAAIPAVLTGLYKYIETDEGLKTITSVSPSESVTWIEKIFTDAAPELITKIADYSNSPYDIANSKVYEIANEAVRVIKEHLNSPGNISNVRDFMLAQRNNILPYLPAALQTGKLLNESALDDRTNKMKGPVSNFMHGIETIFSGSDNPDNKDKF
jgi:hypothetical protein